MKWDEIAPLMRTWLNRWIDRAERDRLESLADRRLVVVCGPRGSGKSRLVSELATCGGLGNVAWVELREDYLPDEVRLRICEALGCPPRVDWTEPIAMSLAERGIDTLVLDGLPSSSLDEVAALAPRIRMIVTSRQPPGPDVPRVELGPLRLDQARALFEARIEEQGARIQSDFGTALERAGRLPAQIEAAARQYGSPLPPDAPSNAPNERDEILYRLSFLCDEFTLSEAAIILGVDESTAGDALRQLRRAGLLYQREDLMFVAGYDEWAAPSETACDWFCEHAATESREWTAQRVRTLWRVVETFGPARTDEIVDALGSHYIAVGAPQIFVRRLEPLGEPGPGGLGKRAVARYRTGDRRWRDDAERLLGPEIPSLALGNALSCLAFEKATSLEALDARLEELDGHVERLEPIYRTGFRLSIIGERFRLGAPLDECADELKRALEFPDSNIQQRAHYLLALIGFRCGQLEEVVRLCRQCVEHCDAARILLHRSYALILLRLAELRMQALSGWDQRVEEDLRWARSHGLLAACAWLELARAERAANEGEIAIFDAAAERAAGYAAGGGLTHDIAPWIEVHRIRMAFQVGDHDAVTTRVLASPIVPDDLRGRSTEARELRLWDLFFRFLLKRDSGQDLAEPLALLSQAADDSYPLQRPIVNLLHALGPPTSSATFSKRPLSWRGCRTTTTSSTGLPFASSESGEPEFSRSSKRSYSPTTSACATVTERGCGSTAN